ncbi:hypothetical protein HWV23_13355 [Natronomonas halophila]|uniref:hypothetical protein n=1 Tax=Natronomonas halophila TaxID=2747817 RepID=UPI0015B3DB9F|nr:hypothetical protein [Natronomonas halophila]QLD86672.1 hypothetical protein HWV23_13355 [Natronomonas halophila]
MVDRSLFVNRRVAVAFVLQVLGYAALLAVYPHSELSPVVETLQAVPTILLIPFAFPAIPAFLLTLALGGILSLIGLSPQSLPALLLARGDVLFFISAYAIGVASAWANRRADELR